MLKCWNTAFSRNLSELKYLSLGNSSHTIHPSWSENAARLAEKHEEWSTQSLPHSSSFLTEADINTVKFRYRNLCSAKFAYATPSPAFRFKLLVPSTLTIFTETLRKRIVFRELAKLIIIEFSSICNLWYVLVARFMRVHEPAIYLEASFGNET